jgi:DNA-binding NarL/FixJ family response regulator
MHRVLVVDDHLLVAQAVGGLLSELCDLDLEAVCGSGRQALHVLGQARPDLLVQDLHLPGESWETVAQMFLHRNPAGKVLILSGLADTFVTPTWLAPSLLGVVDKSRAWNDLIGLVGGACGLFGQPLLSAVAGLFVAAAAVASYRRSRPDDPGLTTEVAMFATFLLGLMTADQPQAAVARATRLHAC